MQTVTDLFQISKKEWVFDARQTMRCLLHDGKPYVTSDDVWRSCPLPDYLHKNTVGSIFNQREFKHVGYTKSTRAAANGRVIQKWALK